MNQPGDRVRIADYGAQERGNEALLTAHTGGLPKKNQATKNKEASKQQTTKHKAQRCYLETKEKPWKQQQKQEHIFQTTMIR